MNLGTWALFGVGVFVFLVWRNHHKKTITMPDGTVVTPVEVPNGYVVDAMNGNVVPAPPKANVAFTTPPKFTAGRESVDYAPTLFPPVVLPVLSANPLTLQDSNTKALGTRLGADRTIARVPSSSIDLSGRQKI